MQSFPSALCNAWKKSKISPDPYESPKIDEKGTKFVQTIVGAALCMGHLIENIIVFATNEIFIQQKNTQNTLSSCAWLLDYMSTYPNPSKMFKKIRHISAHVIWILLSIHMLKQKSRLMFPFSLETNMIPACH